MSIRVMSKVWDSAPYSEDTLLTFLALADWADDDGHCFPGIQQIAGKSRQCERNAQRCIKRLVEDGFLVVINPGGGRGNRPKYQINIDKLAPISKQKGDNKNIKRVTLDTVKGDNCDNAIRKNRQEPSKKQPSVIVPAQRAGGTSPNAVMAKATGESRHHRVHQIIMGFYLDWAEAECPWNGAEGKQLKNLLDSTPRWIDQQFITCLENLGKSPGYVPRGTMPREWLTKLPRFLHGPLNEFGKPLEGVNGNGKQSNVEKSLAVLRAADEKDGQRPV